MVLPVTLGTGSVPHKTLNIKTVLNVKMIFFGDGSPHNAMYRDAPPHNEGEKAVPGARSVVRPPRHWL